MSAVQPNQYTLKGGNITVTYTTTSFLGLPILSYTDSTGTKEFYGSAIRTLDTGIGTLVTVTTRMTIDTGGTEFSVLLPFIELSDASKNQTFETDGIITNFKGPDSFPRTGVAQTYDFIPMQGNARHVLFVFRPIMAAKAG